LRPRYYRARRKDDGKTTGRQRKLSHGRDVRHGTDPARGPSDP
jgi:hypothetical protein